MALPRLRLAHLYEDLEASMVQLRQDDSAVAASRARLETALASGETIYGVNTGFGALARTRIAAEHQQELQRNLLLSHAVGVGEAMPPEISRLMLRLKLYSLGQGYSGVSLPTFRRLLDFDRRRRIPVVPSRGSVGASGDLAPLAHLCLPLIGQGAFWDETGTRCRPAAEVLAEEGWEPLELAAKDGLALINGTQFMSACGAYVLEKAQRLADLYDLAAAMSLEALQGSIKPFDSRVMELRPHAGAMQVAAHIRFLLQDSQILESHRHCGKVQDPYCLRCVPQVHGASRDALTWASTIVETELNSITDNPLVLSDGDILSAGHFHGQPLSIALDTAAMALATLACIAERRIYLLLEGHDGLPRLLMRQTGLNSGFMIPQYTAAALVSENKVLCHPACVDSIPTSLGQEDHVSMGSVAALKLLQVYDNVETVLAIELLTAAQALDYRHPLRPGRGVEAAHQRIRSLIPHREADYLFHEDLQPMFRLIRSDELLIASGLHDRHRPSHENP